MTSRCIRSLAGSSQCGKDCAVGPVEPGPPSLRTAQRCKAVAPAGDDQGLPDGILTGKVKAVLASMVAIRSAAAVGPVITRAPPPSPPRGPESAILPRSCRVPLDLVAFPGRLAGSNLQLWTPSSSPPSCSPESAEERSPLRRSRQGVWLHGCRRYRSCSAGRGGALLDIFEFMFYCRAMSGVYSKHSSSRRQQASIWCRPGYAAFERFSAGPCSAQSHVRLRLAMCKSRVGDGRHPVLRP